MKNKLELYKIVKDACLSKDNPHNSEAWDEHILIVIKYGKILAKKLNANSLVVELACLFHDYASVLDKKYVEEHHLYGSQFAREILTKNQFPGDIVDKTCDCIFTHRASKGLKPASLEARVVASADAIAHIKNVKSLLRYAYATKEKSVQDGADWVLKKVKKSYKKVMPEARYLVDKKCKSIEQVLA